MEPQAKPIVAARNFLLGAQNADGGWPYQPGGQGSPEPACWALLALDSAAGGPREHGVRWLLSRQNPAGAITLAGDAEPHWATSLAVLALPEGPARGRAVEWLLSWEGRRRDPQAAVALDGNLRGWPWMSDTFSWVEPTCYAVLALQRAGRREHPRVAEAGRMLLDRQCADGGWNYGNTTVFGAALNGQIPTTALAVLALREADGAKAAVERGLGFLERQMQTRRSALALALTVLCFSASRKPAGALVAALVARQEPDGSWRRQVHLTALAALALEAAQGGRHVFA
jgi:hypothetical protein